MSLQGPSNKDTEVKSQSQCNMEEGGCVKRGKGHEPRDTGRLQNPENARKRTISSELPEGASLATPDSSPVTSGLQNIRQSIYVVLSQQICSNFL